MKKFMVLFALLLVALPLTVMAQSSDTIVIRGLGNIATWNPHLTSDGAAFQAYSLLWPAPFLTDSFTGSAVPGLTDWTISEDGLTYTFTIRDDAVWSDGVPISADDMIFSVNAIKSDLVDSALETAVALIEAVNKVDDKTYEIVLSGNNCAILSDLSAIRFLPSHLFAADFSDFMTNELTVNPIGISGGPYILDEWAPDEGQRYHANPTYWAGEANIPFLVNRLIGDQAVVVQAIQSGEIDYSAFQGDLFQQIADKSNLQFQSFPALTVNFLALNWADQDNPQNAYDDAGNLVEQTPHRIFSDPVVRKAVVMGFNIDDVLATLGENGGSPLIGIVAPPLAWAYNSQLERTAYDPEGAMALLEENGWVDSDGDGVREKDGVTLNFTISYSNILQHFETTALVAQDQLNQIGFGVEVELVEWANFLSDTFYGQTYDATALSNSGGTSTPDPDAFTPLILSSEDVVGSGSNTTSYINLEVDALVEQARTLPGCDPAARAEIYYQIQQIQQDDVAYNYTYVPSVFQVANNRVGNFNPGPAWVFYGYTAYIHEWTLE